EWRTAALRLFLIPLNYTQLEVTPGNHAIKVGSQLAIRATITGRPVSAAELQYRSAPGDEWTSLSLLSDGGEPGKLLGTLETTVQDCRDDLEYRVVAGPIESPVYHVTVLHPLELKQIEATVAPPIYTRRPTMIIKEGNLRVIAGSRVGFQITVDRAPQTA